MEIIDKLIVKWKKMSLKQKIITVSIIVCMIFLLFLNQVFFSHNKVENSGKIAKDNFTDNSYNKGTNTRDITNNGNGDIIIGNKIIQQKDKEELEEFRIKILNSSYDTIFKVILYEGKNCLENKKIETEYDDSNEEYVFNIMMKRNERKELSVNKQNYLCENFIIEESNQKDIKPIRLKIDCHILPNNNECLVRGK